MNLDDYKLPAPRLPQNRFSYPMQLFEDGVVPLVPFSDERLNSNFLLHCAYDCGTVNGENLDACEDSHFNVGLLCGRPTGTIVLEVTSRSTQSWLNEQPLPLTPQWLCRGSRCYLFFAGPLANPVTEVRPGLRLLSTGAHVPLPGTMYEDGRVIYWEASPSDVEIEELPSWLIPPSARELPRDRRVS